MRKQHFGSAKVSLLVGATVLLSACGGGEGLGDVVDEALGRSTWKTIASEGQTFTISPAGSYTVRFGANGVWVQKSITTTGACSVPNFGSDPAPGVIKTCQLRGTASATNDGATPRLTSTSPSTTTSTTSTATTTSTTPVVDGSQPWSDPATWGGTLPTAGSVVVVPAGKVITLDVNPPSLAGLNIQGTLRFARQDIQLTTGYIDLTGTLEIGTATAPFTNKAVITLNGAPAATNDGVSRGLNVRGGSLQLYGAVPTPVWTKLNDHAQAGATTLTLKDSTNWKPGDLLAIGPTDWYGVAATERIAVGTASGTQVGLAAPLGKFRWGKMQYVTNSGMSLTPDPSYVPPATPAPTELDQRAPVANLTRNIVIEGANDSAWTTSGFGAHVMIMNLTSKVVVDGVEIRRAGQAGTLARYPFHWHLLSYDGAGTLIGDATGHVIRNSTVWQSSQRCIVIHATNGVQVRNNVCQDVKGHAYFMEDAVERRNVLDGNLALMVRQPLATQRLQAHEAPNWKRGPSGFWLTNPDNVTTNNLAADTEGNGFWLAFPRKPLGNSKAVPILPDRLPHGNFSFNIAHSNLGPGVMLEFAPYDDAGNTIENTYIPTTDGSEDSFWNRVRFELKRVTSFKNNDGAYRNRVSAPDYLEWVTADNIGTHFTGAGARGVIARALVVGTSLNSSTPYPSPDNPPAGVATYHSTFAMRDNTFVSMPATMGRVSGAFRADDYYTNPIEVGTAQNTNNRYINASHGFRTLPPNLDGQPQNNRNWTYAGALLDNAGAVGPKGNWWVYNFPFFTAGRACVLVESTGTNGASCPGPYYGVGSFRTDFDPSQWTFMAAIDVRRHDNSGLEIGNWSVADGRTSVALGWMRHFAAASGGRFSLRFPGYANPKEVYLSISNLKLSSDNFVLGIAFDGTMNPSVQLAAGFNESQVATFTPSTDPRWQYVRQMQSGGSLTEVANSSGNLFWHDKANNILWVKAQGGLPYPTIYDDPPNSNYSFTRELTPYRLIVRGTPMTVAKADDLINQGGDLNQLLEATASGRQREIKWLLEELDEKLPTLTLTADTQATEATEYILYSAKLSVPAGADLTVTLSNGALIEIKEGQSEASVRVPMSTALEQAGKGLADLIQVYVVKVDGTNLRSLAINDSNAVTIVNRR